jgi:hypothetical protein
MAAAWSGYFRERPEDRTLVLRKTPEKPAGIAADSL